MPKVSGKKQTRNQSRAQSRTHSRTQSRNQSRKQSRKQSRNQSRKQSRNQSRNQSRKKPEKAGSNRQGIPDFNNLQRRFNTLTHQMNSEFIDSFRGNIDRLKDFIIELLLYFALNEKEQTIWKSLVKIIMFDYILLMLSEATAGGPVHPETAVQRKKLLDASILDPEYNFIEIDDESAKYKNKIELKIFIDSISTKIDTIAGSEIRGTFDFLKNFVLRVLKYLDDNNKTAIVNSIKSKY